MSKLFKRVSKFVREGNLEDVTTGWPLVWTRAIGVPHPLPCSWNVSSVYSSTGAVPRTQPWESNVSLRPSGRYKWLNPGKASISTFKILAGRSRNLLVLQLPLCKFPSLLNLPPINVKRSPSFFSLSLPCMYRDQFASQQRLVVTVLYR